MPSLVFPIIGCALLIFFILGAVCGVQWANGRVIPWQARSKQQAAAEALTGQLERLRAELGDTRWPVIPGQVEERTTLPVRTNPAVNRRASHRGAR